MAEDKELSSEKILIYEIDEEMISDKILIMIMNFLAMIMIIM